MLPPMMHLKNARQGREAVRAGYILRDPGGALNQNYLLSNLHQFGIFFRKVVISRTGRGPRRCPTPGN
jgi:hypothetical protein